MKKMLIGVVAMMLLAGCSGGKTTKTVCKSATNEEVTMTSEINATGDKVTMTKETGKMDFSDTKKYGDATDSDIESLAKELKNRYKDLDGVEAKTSVKDKVLDYTVTFDYEKADLDELEEKELIAFEKDGKIKYIGLQAMIDGFKEQGMTCKEEK